MVSDLRPIPREPRLPPSIASPKSPREILGYRYYAGFSQEFVRDVLRLWDPKTSILDPWNGSGTTTRIAAELGLRAIGIDLNPAMVVVAKSQLVTRRDHRRIEQDRQHLRGLRVQRAEVEDADPLLQWFDAKSVRKVRGLQDALFGRTKFGIDDINSLSSRDAYWLTMMFNCLKGHMGSWRSSNPTWVRTRGIEPKGIVNWTALKSGVLSAAGRADMLDLTHLQEAVRVGSASDLSDFGTAFDLILGSPPYLTRIDYAVATRVELSVLGMTEVEQNDLRRRLLGTTTVPRTRDILVPELGPIASDALDAVATHPSKASSTYYWKWLAQFLAGYASSLEQLSKAARQGATIGLVVQDSYYKEVHLDLPAMTVEMMHARGWRPHQAYDFAPRRSMAQINPRASAYQNGATPRERALFFRQA